MRMTLLGLALVSACGGGSSTPDAFQITGDDSGSGSGSAGLFNAFATQSTVWPGAFDEVQLFFQSPDANTWNVEIVGAQVPVTLSRTTLDAAHPRVYALVDIPTVAQSTDLIQFTARVTNGSDVREAPVQIGFYNLDEAEPGFEVYVAPTSYTQSTDAPVQYVARVISHGGFTGDVSLVASNVAYDARVMPATLTLTANGRATAAIELDRVSPLDVRGASGRVVKNAIAMSAPELTPAASPTVLMSLPLHVYAKAGDTKPLPVTLAGTNGNVAPSTVSLVSPPAGITLDAGGLHIGGAVASGVYPLTVMATGSPGSAQRTIRLVVVGTPLIAPHGAYAMYANGSPLEVIQSTARSTWNGTTWATTQEDGTMLRVLSRGTLRIESRRAANNGVITIKEVDLDPSSFGTRYWSPNFFPFVAPAIAVDGFGEMWAAGYANGITVYRYGTVGGGVPILSGLPLSTQEPLIAAGGATVALAVVTSTNHLDVRTYNRMTLAFDALPSPNATLAPLTSPVLDVDASGRPVVAWIDAADELVHVARYAGAWTSLGTFATNSGTIALSIALDADASGAVTLLVYEAAHAPIAGYPVATTQSAVRVLRITDPGVYSETVLPPLDGQSAIVGAAFDLDANGTPVVATSEAGATIVTTVP